MKLNGSGGRQPIVVAAMYKFVQLPDYRELRQSLLDVCLEHGVKGTLLLANEGINGTIAGTREAIDTVLAYLRNDERLSDLQHKESYHSQVPFYRMKVKLKKEIVSMGIDSLRPELVTGKRVGVKEWNALIEDPEVLVIDTRNQYEYEVGTFKNAVSPETETFREFPDYVEKELGQHKQKKIAMFCTGGIRCEKASALLLEQGFEQIYQLNGGILQYLEDVSDEENLWQGECFVFDGRVAVNESLESGNYTQCFACRRPLSNEELLSEKYQQGISCPYCYDKLDEAKKDRLSERQRQVELAEKGRYQHIGAALKTKGSHDKTM